MLPDRHIRLNMCAFNAWSTGRVLVGMAFRKATIGWAQTREPEPCTRSVLTWTLRVHCCRSGCGAESKSSKFNVTGDDTVWMIRTTHSSLFPCQCRASKPRLLPFINH